MTQNRTTYLATLITALFLAGSSEAKAAGPPAPETSPAPEQKTTPVDQATAGEITGKISFEGSKPKLATIMMDKDPVCVGEYTGPVHVEDGEVNSDGTLPNVFVYVKEGAEKHSYIAPRQPIILDQAGCMYHPHVLGIMAGQELRVVSSDPTTHNIHPMPKNNREWNQSQPPGASPIARKFARPEVMIPVKCNQHPWMKAYIGVTSNPFYAVTGSDGMFTIKGLPAGDYTLEAWTATFGTQQRKVTVRTQESATVDFIFKQENPNALDEKQEEKKEAETAKKPRRSHENTQ